MNVVASAGVLSRPSVVPTPAGGPHRQVAPLGCRGGGRRGRAVVGYRRRVARHLVEVRAHGVDPVDREPVEQRSTPATRWPTDFDPTTLTLDRVRGVLRDGPR